jgi:uncharacterized protein DUF4349
MFSHRKLSGPLVLILSSAIAACDQTGFVTADTSAAAAAAMEPARERADVPLAVAFRKLPARELAARQSTGAPQQPSTAPAAPASPSMIIRNGEITVQVDSVELAMEAVRKLAASLGGYVGNVSVATGVHQVRSGSLEMKIPAARFDDAMGGMQPLGKVEFSSATAQDVGEEFVDVSARVANAKRLEQRLVSLLATRTGKLEDVLAVERELARVREEIERYEGRIRYLGSRVATSTIVVSVHEKAPIVAGMPGQNPMRIALVNMWRNFVRFVTIGIELLGVVIPAAAIVGLLALGWRRWRRARVVATAS